MKRSRLTYTGKAWLTAAIACFSLSTVSASAQMTTDNWRLLLLISGEGGTPDNITQLGTDPEAVNGWDADFDFPNPPPIGESYIDAYFDHPDDSLGWQGVGGHYTTDIRYPLTDEGELREWQLTLATTLGAPGNPAEIRVTWPGIVDIPPTLGFTLNDPDDLNEDGILSYDMRGLDSFSFSVTASGTQVVYPLSITAELTGTTPPTREPGDVNGDEVVSIIDATLALRAAIGLEVLIGADFEAADFNDDGAVTVADATLILRRAVGLD